MKYSTLCSGFKDYVSLYAGNREVVQVPTRTLSEFERITTEFNIIATLINSYTEVIEGISRLKGMEPWIEDREMKELFQQVIYPLIEKYEKQANRPLV